MPLIKGQEKKRNCASLIVPIKIYECTFLFRSRKGSVSRQERFECSCCEFMVAKITGQRLSCYLIVVYRSPIKYGSQSV